jgi:hypothetical protein
MNNVNPNWAVNVLWSKEAISLVKAELQWKANDIEIRLKSLYPLLLFYDRPEIQPQPKRNPNP